MHTHMAHIQISNKKQTHQCSTMKNKRVSYRKQIARQHSYNIQVRGRLRKNFVALL